MEDTMSKMKVSKILKTLIQHRKTKSLPLRNPNVKFKVCAVTAVSSASLQLAQMQILIRM